MIAGPGIPQKTTGAYFNQGTRIDAAESVTPKTKANENKTPEKKSKRGPTNAYPDLSRGLPERCVIASTINNRDRNPC